MNEEMQSRRDVLRMGGTGVGIGIGLRGDLHDVVAAQSVATIEISNQESDGESVTVDNVVMSEGGFVVIHDETLFDGQVAGSIRGHSEHILAGESFDVVVSLDRPLSETQTVIAMPHLDTNGNEQYDFPDADGPYVRENQAVMDEATVTVRQSRPTTTQPQTTTEIPTTEERQVATEGPTDRTIGGYPMYSADAANTGHTPDQRGPGAPVTDRWRFSTGDFVRSSPTVVDGTVYVGNNDGTLYAIDAATGIEIWTAPVGESVFAAPAVGDETVFIGTDRGLYALDATDGSRRWRDSRNVDGGQIRMSSPTVSGRSVYIGSRDGFLRALDVESGREQWRFDAGDRGVETSPAVVDGTVYIGSATGILHAVDARSGDELWRFDTDGAVGSSPAVADSVVYFGNSSSRLYALDIESGTQRWVFDTEGNVTSSPAIANGLVYCCTREGTIHAVDATTGQESWHESGFDDIASAPVVADGNVYIGGRRSAVSLNAVNGDQLWRFETGTWVSSSPAVADSTIYFGSGDGMIYGVTEGRGPANSAGTTTVNWQSTEGGQALPQFDAPQVESDQISYIGATVSGFALLLLAIWRYGMTNEVPEPTSTATGTPIDSWPAPRLSSGRAARPERAGPVTDLETAWRYKPKEDSIATPAAVDGDRVYAITEEGYLLSILAEAASSQWSVDVDSDHTTTPVLYDGKVCLGTESGVSAYDATNGDRQWVIRTPAVSAIAAGDQIYAATERSVIAISARGEREWETTFGEQPEALVVGKNRVYVATGTALVAIDSRTGTRHWDYDAVSNDPHLAVDDTLVAAVRDGVFGFDMDNEEQLWKQLDSVPTTGIALAHGRVYRVTDTAVEALDQQTGEEVWRAILDATTAPTIVGDIVYVGTAGDVVALSADDGSRIATHDFAGALSAPIVIGDTMFCQASDGFLTAVTGELADEPTLQERLDERVTANDGSENIRDDQPEANDEREVNDDRSAPSTVAKQFAQRCDSVDTAEVVDTTRSVHIYDGTVIDGTSETEARVYTLAPDVSDHDDARAAFLNAAREWQSISKNPHVTTVYRYNENPRPWVAFDAGSGPLRQELSELDKENGVTAITELAEAVRTGGMYNLVHGGIDPNVAFRSTDMEGEMVTTLGDWGLHLAVERALDDTVVTPYTAPEQLAGDTAGTATDVYRLGAVAYQVLTGTKPFKNASNLATAIEDGTLLMPSEVNESIPTTIDDVLLRAMEPNPEDRYESAYEFRRHLLDSLQ